MLLRNRNPKAVIMFGMACFVAAQLWRRFVHPSASLSMNWIDAITGFLMGLAIGAMLLGVWLNARRRSQH